MSDKDREKWLDNLVAAIGEKQNETIILACSALTPFVQGELLERTGRAVSWCLLDGSPETLLGRMKARDHFMPPELLESQLAALQPPAGAVHYSIEDTPSDIAQAILSTYKHHQ